MKVEIKPIEIKKWHGKKDKESFAQPKTFAAEYNPDLGKYDTGLTEQEAKELGAKLGLDLSDTYVPEQDHPFWGSKAAKVTLPNQTIFFDTNKPLELIKYKNCLASKHVANSQREYDEGKWPEATHVIYSEEEEQADKAAKVQLKQKCYATLSKLSKDEKINLILIILEESVRGRSDNFIDTRSEEMITEFPEEFLKWASMDITELNIRGSILEGIARGILTKEGQSIYYMSERLGFDIEDTIKWFSDQNNQKTKVAILEKLTA